MNRATWSPSTTAERPKQSKAAGAQDQKVTNGGVTTTVGVVVLWPALLMLKGKWRGCKPHTALRQRSRLGAHER
jgi:hypothetical protein